MIRIVIQSDIAAQIRSSEGLVELVDDRGERVGVIRRPPTDDEIRFAKRRIGSKGQKFTVDQLIAKVESL